MSRTTGRKVSWWNEELAQLRKKTRKLYNRAKKINEWTTYSETLTEYNRALRKAKRDSWRRFCEDVESVSEAARLQKIMAKNPINPMGSIKKPTGEFTNTGKETLEVLLETHFPGSLIVNPENAHCQQNPERLHSRATRDDWQITKRVINYDRVIWAINSFDAYKSPGPDGIFPALLQQGQEDLAPVLCRLYRASMALGHVPPAWRHVRVVFVPKPGRNSYAQAKAYRAISLSSFVLKAMEKLLEKHIRETYLLERPLHPNQHAYQAGKSCETALHQLMLKVETSLKNQEIALGAFLDIEGAFDNTSFESMILAASNRGIDNTTCRWVKAMLQSRQVHATLVNETTHVSVAKGCPQGGVLSPLLWDMVIDELIVLLNNLGYYTQGYADDIVILTQGKHAGAVSELMQGALGIVEGWCIKENLRVNPTKTKLIPFTNKRKLDKLKPPTLFNEQLQVSREVKYLGLILDCKLTWNPHLEYVINRCKIVLMMSRRTFGTTWGLKPRMVHWLYTAVIRPMITYGCLVWWPKLEQRQATTKLSKVQRLACLCITGAMRSSPTAAMETMLNLPPLDIFIKGEARMGAYRLNCNGNWKTQNHIGHTRIMNMIANPILNMGSDVMIPKFSYDKPFEVQLDWEEWRHQERQSWSNDLFWYTDGSKTDDGSGAGIYSEALKQNISLPLGRYTTVFQAEIHAIETCIRENLRRLFIGRRIYILSDSQAALKALACCRITSKLVWDCLQNLKLLAKRNKVTLVWVPGHKGIAGNERADELARMGSETPFTGPEPVFGIPKTMTRRTVAEWVKQQHQQYWDNVEGQRHSKLMMEKQSNQLTANILQLNRTQLRVVTGLLTGHCHLRKHLYKMGIFRNEPLCRLCNEEEETASHIIFECEAIAYRRQNFLGDTNPDEGPPEKDLPRRLLALVKGLNLLT